LPSTGEDFSEAVVSDPKSAENLIRLIDIETAIGGLGKAFQAIAERKPSAVVEADYTIAGYPMRVRTAGPQQAANIDRALGHLRADGGADPALTIEVWNDEEVGPAGWAPWPEDAETNGTITFSEDNRYVFTQRRGSALLLDRKENHIAGCLRGWNTLYQDERVRPFHRLISIWLDDRNIQFIHAGLVSHGEKGLLFVGKGGSGKSTTSISCFLGGLKFLSDDYVALEAPAEGGFVGHSIYATCLADHIGRFPKLAPIAMAPNYPFEVKDGVFLGDLPDGRFSAQANLAAVILPKIVDRPNTTYRPAKTMESLRTLAPSSLWILPNSAGLSMDKLGGLMTSVPSFWLELGRDIGEIVPTIERLCGELGG
jgi:hypothetical protein